LAVYYDKFCIKQNGGYSLSYFFGGFILGCMRNHATFFMKNRWDYPASTL
jgi:hypothetical protein